MALSHGGFGFFGTTTHNDVLPTGPHDVSDVHAKFFGVIGESELRGEPGGRWLQCKMTLRGYSTAQLLISDFNTINSKVNKLTGTLTVTGNLAATYVNCSFKGATREKIIHDAATGNYLCDIMLRWRQLKKDT